MRETDLLDVKHYCAIAPKEEISDLFEILETRRLELQFERIHTLKERKALKHFRRKMSIENAILMYGESIVNSLESQGLIYKKGSDYYKTEE